MTVPAWMDVPVHEIRDYHQVNLLVSGHLDRGASRIRLVGVSGQRLLLSGLRGSWHAIIEMEGRPGPELALGMNCPGLTVLARGGVDHGAASGLKQGHLLINGMAGDALAYRQLGGVVIAVNEVGPRAGLEQHGGLLVLGDRAGRLVGERQRGGIILLRNALAVAHVGRGRSGGTIVEWPDRANPEERDQVREAIGTLGADLPREIATWLETI